jgi:glycosyltransferase involved in cell wall biosynthesis
MRRHGFGTALIAPTHSQIYQRAATEGFKVYPVKFSSKADISSWTTIYRLLKTLRPAVVNTHSSKDSWMAGLVARLLNVPLIVRTRHVSTAIGSSFSYNRFPHLIITTSSAIRDNLTVRSVNGEKIAIVPTGIDLQRFKYSVEDRSQIRTLFNVSDNEILVGNICVLRSWKGLDFFVETAAAMPEGFKFILVGEGPVRDRLEKIVAELGLTARFIFTGHQEKVEGFFSALDIFFFTSYASEGVPQSLLQALSIGLPIVVCRNPSVLEAVEGIYEPQVINHGDVADARAALLDISKYLQRDEDAIRQRRSIIKQKYALESMWRHLIALYDSCGIHPAQGK